MLALPATGADGVWSQNIVVDTTPQAVTLNPFSTLGNQPTFTGTATAGYGTVTVTIYSGAGTGGTVAATLTTSGSSGSYSVSTGSALADGIYTALASQVDGSSVTHYSSSSVFMVDTHAPVVTVPGSQSVNQTTNLTVAGISVTDPRSRDRTDHALSNRRCVDAQQRDGLDLHQRRERHVKHGLYRQCGQHQRGSE